MVSFTLIEGSNFTKADIATAGEQIDINTSVNKYLVGGMSYLIDPKMVAHFPNKPSDDCHPDDKCQIEAKELLDCLDLNAQKIKSVCIDEVILRVKFDN